MDFLDQSNQLITDILKETSSSVSENWNSITLTATYISSPSWVVDIRSLYFIDNQEQQFKTPGQVGLKLLKLAKLLSSPEKGSLKKAIFTLQKSGKFDVRYEY